MDLRILILGYTEYLIISEKVEKMQHEVCSKIIVII